MVVHKKKKVGKYRGSSNHGGGMRKKRRGAGSRGGKGRAGTGKRAGQKKAGMPNQLGAQGFLPRRSRVNVKAINLNYFTKDKVEKLLTQGKAVKEGNVIAIDLGELGYGKLLGTGIVEMKLKLSVDRCSASAAEKVKAAGGEVLSSDVTNEEES